MWTPPSDASLTATSLGVAGTLDAAPDRPAPPATVDRSVFRTAFVVIALGATVAFATYVWGRSAAVEPADLIRNGLYTTLALYVLTAAMVVRKAQQVSFRPVWTEGDSTESLLRGILVGGALAAVLLFLSYSVTGRLTTDRGIEVLVSERTPIRALAAILIACVAAPWVEELLFRGLLTESLRPKGMKAAALLSGVLFAAWHPQALFPMLDSFFGGDNGQGGFGPMLYYIAMGALFGRLYLKRGLKCSIAAHTAFNGLIVIAALTATVGPTHTVASHGITVEVPATWHKNDTPVPENIDLVLDGPSGAQLIVMHLPMPPGAQVTADQAAANLAQGLAFPGVEVDAAGARVVDLPVGRAARVRATAQGHAAEVVLIPTGDVLWEVVLATAGSERASKDFEKILTKIELPSAANP